MVAPETARAAQTTFCGVQVSSTVKVEPPSAWMSAAVTCQPLANPSTRCDPPRSTACAPGAAPGPGVATAFQPLFTLWPSTSSNGSVAPVTRAPWLSMWTDVACTVAAGPGWVASNWGVPDAVGKAAEPAPPPEAESRASWSMFQPVHVVGAFAQGALWPAAVCTMWGPALSVMPLASGPHGTTWLSPPFRARDVGPTTDTSMGCAVDSQEVGDAVAREGGRYRVDTRTGDADLCDAQRQRQRARRVIVRRVLRPDAGEGHDEV